jgi:Holliday junction resolvase
VKIDPGIIATLWEAAALDQLSRQLRSEGYDIEREVAVGRHKVDLIARRGNEAIVYEVKAPGRDGGRDWASAAAQVREYARSLGARFHLVVVRPPREVQIEVEGIEQALETAMRDSMPPELEELSSRTSVNDVTGVDVTSISVQDDKIQVEGDGTVVALLRSGDDDLVSTESFPFEFRAVLDRANQITELTDVHVDTSSWYGDDEEEDEHASGGTSLAEDHQDF